MSGAFGDGAFGEGSIDGVSVYTSFGVDLNPIVLLGTGTINCNPTVSDVLEDQHNILLYAAEIHPWALTGSSSVFYVATQQFGSLPTDTPASQPFDSSLDQPLSVRRSILGSEIGIFTVGDGILEINNTDASYDYLIGDYAIDGRNVKVKAGRLGDLYSTDFVTVFNGTASDWTISEDAVHIVLRDYSYRLNVPAQTNLYLGTGSSNGGSDLTNKRKPRGFGFLLNVTPPAVDASLLTYQLNDGRIHGVNAVYDRGAALTPNSTSPDVPVAIDYATYAALEAAPVASGGFITCLAEGFIKLGSVPSGTITVDFEGDSLGGTFVSTTGAIIRRLITTSTDLVDPTDLYTSSFTDMELLQVDDIGYWMGTDSTETVAEVIAKLMKGVGGWGGFRRDGTFELRVFRTPGIIDALTSDPYTKLLLHGNGTPGSTTFIDELGHTVTGIGSGVSIGPDSPDTAKFGGGGIKFDSSVSPDQHAYLFIPTFADLSPSADFTIDFWLNLPSFIAAPTPTIFTRSSQLVVGSNGLPLSPIHFRIAASTIIIEMSSDGLTNDIGTISEPTAIQQGVWYHFALVRAGNVYYYFKNGIKLRTLNSPKTPYFSTDPMTIGARIKNGVAEAFFNGYIDEFRYSNGIARWTTDFTLPVVAYTVQPSVTSTPVARYDLTNIFSISREPLPDSLTPLPWRHRVMCQRNWTVQTDLAGVVSSTQRTFAAEAFRLAEASDLNIKANHPFAKDLDPIEAYFHHQSAAQTEANRRLATYTEEASMFRMAIPAYAVLRVNIGDIIHVTYPRWDLISGRKLTVVEINEDARANRFEIVAYG